ncbi:SDR family oxidoreductase [Pseudarthrobacter sp. J75]|uniref:SDR family oxidoreductase n=1 Tax=unclassified Pseudarthrobacter TaxID=2647000 RepID=UPI002E815717|nr:MULTISPECIES: SDR family oxidoreductase [unclassified Pseudarthrobacter]MEE2523523.1 SDR family oxidoreductase [Pseudarthrobacter sp. J47]MEE2530498.1 SDR family oxidoreductase [Pseudarthrobacter sp. J75]
MSIVITGATGHLGRLVLEALLNRNVPAEEIVAVGRSTEKLAEFAARGVQVKAMDYDDAASVSEALKGAQKVLLISGSEVGKRVGQHRAVIEAAKAEGVELLAYTSIANAGTTGMKLAAEHHATEELLKESGVPFALLRNSWYLENYTAQIPTYLEYGVSGSAGEGRVSAATRADYAEAAAAVLVSEGQAGKVYELGGEAFSLSGLAAEVGAAAGKEVSYHDLPAEDFAKLLEGAGVPGPFAEILADSDLGIARGDLLVSGSDLATLLGRPATSMQQAVRESVDALEPTR